MRRNSPFQTEALQTHRWLVQCNHQRIHPTSAPSPPLEHLHDRASTSNTQQRNKHKHSQHIINYDITDQKKETIKLSQNIWKSRITNVVELNPETFADVRLCVNDWQTCSSTGASEDTTSHKTIQPSLRNSIQVWSILPQTKCIKNFKHLTLSNAFNANILL